MLLFNFLYKKFCHKFNEICVRARENFSGVMYLDMANFDLLGQTPLFQGPAGGL